MTIQTIKTKIRHLVRRTGYDIVRFGEGHDDAAPSFEVQRSSKIQKEDGIGADPFLDMQRFLKNQNAPVIFDVGANVGQSVDRFLRLFPESAIHSFEPSPTTYEKLQSHCSPFPNVKAWNYGVGREEAVLPFQENDNSDMSSFLSPSEFSWGKIIKTTDVPVITLDSFSKKQGIDFIHILKSDAQGYDFEVFKGAEGLMKENRIGLIYFEFIFSDMYKNLPRFHDVFRYLTENNFDLVAFYDSHFQNELVSWTDALFINKEYNRNVRTRH